MFLDYTRFGFELIKQKMYKMKILKITHLTYLVIFHLKVIVCQNVNLPPLLEILSFATNHYAIGMQLVVVYNYLGHVCIYKFGIV
jgi:hypothetical protein